MSEPKEKTISQQEVMDIDKETVSVLTKIEKDLHGYLDRGGVTSEGFKYRSHIIPNSELARKLRDELIKKYGPLGEFITALTEIFHPTPESYQLTAHLVWTYREHPEIMRKFWQIFLDLASLQGEAVKQGIISHVAAMQIFEKLGFSVRFATPQEDAEGVDFFANNIPVQVKTKGGRRLLGISSKPFLPSSSNQVSKIIISVYRGKSVNPYTGQPGQELVEKAKQRLIELNVYPNK